MVCKVAESTITVSSKSIPEIESKTDRESINIKEWLLANKLGLNPLETECLLGTILTETKHRVLKETI